MGQGPRAYHSPRASGPGCSLTNCTVGDNPMTDGDKEVQQLTCDATSGTFTLTFRGQTTTAIAYNAVATISDETAGSSAAGTGEGESVQAKLQALTSITTYCYGN